MRGSTVLAALALAIAACVLPAPPAGAEAPALRFSPSTAGPGDTLQLTATFTHSQGAAPTRVRLTLGIAARVRGDWVRPIPTPSGLTACQAPVPEGPDPDVITCGWSPTAPTSVTLRVGIRVPASAGAGPAEVDADTLDDQAVIDHATASFVVVTSAVPRVSVAPTSLRPGGRGVVTATFTAATTGDAKAELDVVESPHDWGRLEPADGTFSVLAGCGFTARGVVCGFGMSAVGDVGRMSIPIDVDAHAPVGATVTVRACSNSGTSSQLCATARLVVASVTSPTPTATSGQATASPSPNTTSRRASSTGPTTTATESGEPSASTTASTTAASTPANADVGGAAADVSSTGAAPATGLVVGAVGVAALLGAGLLWWRRRGL